MVYFSKVLLIFLLLLSVLGCLDEIDLVPEKDRLKGVSINGQIVKGDPSFISVLVKPIFTFSGESRAITPVEKVYLQNEEGQQYLIEERLAVGQYRQVIDPSFEITYDQSYQLVVQLSDGRTYESAFVKILPSVPVQSLDFEIVQEDRFSPITGRLEARDFIQYKINTPLSEKSSDEKALLHWKAFKFNRYIIETAQECYTNQSADVNYIGLFDGNRLSSDTLRDFPFFRDFIEDSFSDTYYFIVVQENLQEEAFQYWNQVQVSINRDGNMFEPSAGLINTNIRNTSEEEDNVQGFFYATEQSTFRIRVCPSDLGLSFRKQLCNGCLCQNEEPPSFWENCN